MRHLEIEGQAGFLRRWWPVCVWTAVILFVVFPWRSYQDHPHWARVQWLPFVTPPVKLRDIVGNVLLYMPFGYWIMRATSTQRLTRAVLLGALLSTFTEFSQVYSHGRFPSTGDLVCNVGGTWLGARRGRRPPGGAAQST